MDKNISKEKLGRMKQKAGSNLALRQGRLRCPRLLTGQGRQGSVRPPAADGPVAYRVSSQGKAHQPVSSFNLDCVRTRQQSADLQYLLKLLLPGLERQAEGQFTCPGNRDGQSRVAGRPLQAQRRTEAGSVISINWQPLLPNSHCLKFSLPVQAEPQGAMTPPSRTRRQLDHSQR